MGSFLRQKRVVKKLVFLAGLCVALLVHVLFFGAAFGELLTFSKAYETIRFGQEIGPFNPIKEAEGIRPGGEASRMDFRSSKYRVIKVLADADEEERYGEGTEDVAGPLVTIKGRALFPDSDVFLEIHSHPFMSSVKSDAQGNWSWSNWGRPLEDGKHSIEAYNISPYELSSKRDVFAQKYEFVVDGGRQGGAAQEMVFKDRGYEEKPGDGDFGDVLLEGKVESLYFFDAVLPNKREYDPGEELDLQLLFRGLAENSQKEARVSYELFRYELTEADAKSVGKLSDTLRLGPENSFLKRIKLKERMVGGNHFLAVSVSVDGKEYVQHVKFFLNDEEVVKVGSFVVTQEKLNKALVWNIVIILTMTIITLLFIIREYKRYFVYRPVDEDMLRGRGYF